MKNNYQINQQQEKAIQWLEGPLRVIAGAGSGKTFVLTQRISRLIKEIGIFPRKILAITFTNKAANEMKERIQKEVLKGDQISPDIYTYHGLCVRILRQEIHHLGYPVNFRILDEEDQKEILKDAYSKLQITKSEYDYWDVMDYIESQKYARSSPDESYAYAVGDGIDSLVVKAKIYKEYCAMQKTLFALDFNDLLLMVAKLFDEIQEVKDKWAKYYDYILVDEFQDTNDIQYEIIHNLSRLSTNLFVVGDPDQTIYSWRGADINIILHRIEKDYPKVQTVILEENYRCTKNILNLSNSLIENNDNRIKKELVTNNVEGKVAEHYLGFSGEDEANWVAKKIAFMVKNQKAPLSNFCILYRSKFLSRNIEQSLIHNNLQYKVFGSFKFFQRKEIKDAISYLQLICSFDNLSLKRIINVPSRQIGEISLNKILEFAEQRSLTIWQAITNCLGEINISDGIKNRLRDLITLVNKYHALKDINSLNEIYESFLKEVGYFSMLEKEEVDSVRKDNLEELRNSIKNYESKNNPATLENYLQEISLYTASDENITGEFVSLMTIHTVKGLEFPYVFVIGLNESYFPSNQSLDNEESVEEERRIAYVAFTRAKQELFLTSSRGYSFVTKSNLEPSRFISEIDKKYIKKVYEAAKAISENPDEFFDSTKKSKETFFHEGESYQFTPNEKIIHKVYGEGIVISVHGQIIQVAFKHPHGVKTLMANHKAIIRVVN